MERSNLYAILGVYRNASFDELKRAYRSKAKECHPDLFGNDQAKTEIFQELVHAFDILSDPDSRTQYDKRLDFESAATISSSAIRSQSIMDTIADDILEEMVVGNDVPKHTTLMTLMLDLEHTENFICFRQAKTFFFCGEYKQCGHLCEKLVEISPNNILYHYYLGESARMQRHFSKAAKHFRICLQLGLLRTPPQRLSKIRRHCRYAEEHRGFWGKLMAYFLGEEEIQPISEEEKMRRILEDTFSSGNKQQKRLHSQRKSSRTLPSAKN